MVEFENAPAQARKILDTQFAPTFATVMQAPLTLEEMKKIYGSANVTASDRGLTKANRAQVASLAGIGLTRTAGVGTQTLSHVLEMNPDANFVMVLGHNEGGIFKFTDGTAMEIGKISDTLQSPGHQRIPILISCGGSGGSGGNCPPGSVCVGRDISWPDAFCLVRKVYALLREAQASGGRISPAEIQARINASDKMACNTNAKAFVYFVAACGGLREIFMLVFEHDASAREPQGKKRQ
jgi:hypothetical protein